MSGVTGPAGGQATFAVRALSVGDHRRSQESLWLSLEFRGLRVIGISGEGGPSPLFAVSTRTASRSVLIHIYPRSPSFAGLSWAGPTAFSLLAVYKAGEVATAKRELRPFAFSIRSVFAYRESLIWVAISLAALAPPRLVKGPITIYALVPLPCSKYTVISILIDYARLRTD